jgi:multicomponent Na+:H+ antiporter subunit E
MKKVGVFVTTFAFSFAIYLVLVDSLGNDAVIIGILVSLVSSAVLIRFIDLPIRFLNPIRWVHFIFYLPFFMKEVITANVRIALIVLNPRLPIKPEMKKGKSRLTTPQGRFLLSSSITLTPGTLTVDVERGEFLIHCVSTDKSAEEIMRPFENYIRRITE